MNFAHFCWCCQVSEKPWQDIRFSGNGIYDWFTVLWKDVVFEFFANDQMQEKLFYAINLMLRLATFYIHKSRLSNRGILCEEPAVSDCIPIQKHHISVRQNNPFYKNNKNLFVKHHAFIQFHKHFT